MAMQGNIFNLNDLEDFPPLPGFAYQAPQPPQPQPPLQPQPVPEPDIAPHEPEAVLDTETVVLEQLEPITNTCCICGATFAATEGLRCSSEIGSPSNHFACHSCLSGMTRSYCAMDDDSGVIGKINFDNIHQIISCPGYNPETYESCTHRFKNAKLARIISEDAYDVMQSAIFKLTERHIMRSFESELKSRLKLEIDKYNNSDELTRMLDQHKTHILENCLNLACPRCNVVFDEFDGCYAIECSSCGCGFCAYCLIDCGDDAHEHVLACELNPAQHSDYGDSSDGQFEEVQKNRRTKLVLDYLNAQVTSTDMRTKLITDLEVQFRELGIDVHAAIAASLVTPG